MNSQKLTSEKGFSFIELMIVIAVIAILAVVGVVSLNSNRKYAAVDQATKLIDLLDEARQKALNQRKTFRVEINRTRNRIRLIDEGRDATTANDDFEVKGLPLSTEVVIGGKPGNVTTGPAASSPIPDAAYATSNYPLSSGEQKITLRFRRNGQVVDVGTDNIGTGSVTNGMTIYVYSTTPSTSNPEIIRAVTVLGTSGDTSLYSCKLVAGVCGNWSR